MAATAEAPEIGDSGSEQIDDGDSRRLIERVAAGDPEALATIFDQHAPAVAAEVAPLTGVAVRCAVIGDVFLDFWEHPDPFDVSSASLESLLTAAARHRADALAPAGAEGAAPSGETTDLGSIRSRVVAEAPERRVLGHPSVGADAASPSEAYAHQCERLDLLLDEIEDEAWAARADPYEWTVHELLGHLLGIEDYTGSILGIWDYEPEPGTEHSHLSMTESTIGVERDHTPDMTASTWRERSRAITAHLSTLTEERWGEQISFHNLPHTVSSLVTLRSFEVWTHADDMRRASARELEVPPPQALRAMSDLAVGALPLMVMFAAPDQTHRPAKVVLTGPGGGTWELNESSGPAEATLVADVVDFCRYVASRVDREDLQVEVSGDQDLAGALLDAARMLAV